MTFVLGFAIAYWGDLKGQTSGFSVQSSQYIRESGGGGLSDP